MNFLSAGTPPLRNLQIQEPLEPQLYRNQFPYSEVPRILFDGKMVLPTPASEIWITDTTFRDGQQARAPFTPEQIAHIYSLLHKLGGEKGIIRQSEFFLYSKRDKEAVERCQSLGYRFPEITGWIRMRSDDLEMARSMGIKEVGILTPVSDYHIFLKNKKKRSTAAREYIQFIKEAHESGIHVRCHFEDITRADLYGFALPLAEQCLKLTEESGIPIKLRLCDTMGYGVTYPGAILPRSIPKMVHAFTRELGYPEELLEWHGHNDFHKVHINGTTAWMYGVSALNTTLLGFGERTGNPPLEGAVMEYLSLRGNDSGMNTTVITEIAEYYRQILKAPIPVNYPFTGEDFNTTRAGIPAEGIMKHQEIYNIFDTRVLLNRPLKVTVTEKSGMAGIAGWINENIPRRTGRSFEPVSKRHPGIRHIHDWVLKQYSMGRTTGISPDEMVAQTKHYLPQIFVSDFDQVQEAAKVIARRLAQKIAANTAVIDLNKEKMDDFLTEIIKKEGSIQLLAITNTLGSRISQVHTQRGEKGLFRNLLNKDFRKHQWFKVVLENQEPYYSDLFFSKFTRKLIMTAALPIFDRDNKLFAVIDIDFKFEELVKLISDIPDEILED